MAAGQDREDKPKRTAKMLAEGFFGALTPSEAAFPDDWDLLMEEMEY